MFSLGKDHDRAARRVRIVPWTAILAFWLVLHGPAYAGQLFYAVGWGGDFTHIDSDIGQVPPMRDDLPLHMQALARSPDGTHCAARALTPPFEPVSDIYTINPHTGDVALQLSMDGSVRAMAFSSSGDLYLVNVRSGWSELGMLDLDSGSYTAIGQLHGAMPLAQGLAFSPAGTLYGVAPWDGGLAARLLTIDPGDAETHLVATVAGRLHQSLTFSPDGALYMVGGTSQVGHFARVDPVTGDVLGPTFETQAADLRGVEFVPEPTTHSLLALGGLVVARRRRNQ